MMEKEKAEIAELAAKYGRVQSLMRYVNKEALAKSYSCQLRGKAVGVDGVTKETYGENLNENLDDLLKRMKQFSYKPYPSIFRRECNVSISSKRRSALQRRSR